MDDLVCHVKSSGPIHGSIHFIIERTLIEVKGHLDHGQPQLALQVQSSDCWHLQCTNNLYTYPKYEWQQSRSRCIDAAVVDFSGSFGIYEAPRGCANRDEKV